HGNFAGEALQTGESEAFVIGGHEQAVGRVYPVRHLVRRYGATGQEFRSGQIRDLAGPVEPLLGAVRVRRKEQVPLLWIQSEAPLRAGPVPGSEPGKVRPAGKDGIPSGAERKSRPSGLG